MTKRYQLIKPIVSDKIYETESLNKAASKCYKEIKLNQIAGASTFTIRNVDTNEYIDFSLTRPGIDIRYSVDDSKLRGLNWSPKTNFDEELTKIIEHYSAKFVW